ncbi:MAG TPA: hypothetical protein VJN67_13395 [Stellaceae bacterium]|nr:hypothetical protein [Stellaceae bacterium]
MSANLITALVAFAVLVGVVGLRTVTGNKVEITLNDAIIAAIAAGLTLLISGGVSKLVVGSEGVTIETTKEAILTASRRPIEPQVSSLPVAPVDMVLKGDIGEIPEIVRQRKEALELMLGAGAYEPHAMQVYLDTLTKYPFFRFVVLLDRNSKLFGMVDARKLIAQLEEQHSEQTAATFTTMVNRASADDQAQLAKLPGFVPASAAVVRTSDKRDVLQKMEQLGADWLPVLNSSGKLDGVVDRSRLTASLILDVTDQLRTGAHSDQ